MEHVGQPSGRRATAADVARLAGVSRATVSHVLNGRQANFPSTTQDRVRRAVEELDYRPWPGARDLVSRRSSIIVILLPNVIPGTNIREAAQLVAARTNALAANVVLRFADDDQESTVSGLLELHPLAVIDIGALGRINRERLNRRGISVVPDLDKPLLAGDRKYDELLAELQVDAADPEGDRTLVYVTLTEASGGLYSEARLDSLKALAERRGRPQPLIVEITLSPAESVSSLVPLVQVTPLALIAFNDVVGGVVMAAARLLDLSIPQDVSIVGVDGSELASVLHPTLTTVRVEMSAIMNAALEQLAAIHPDLPLDGTEEPRMPMLYLRSGESTPHSAS